MVGALFAYGKRGIMADVEERDDKPMDETPDEQTEQRTDDYDGLARRMDDVYDMLKAMGDKMAQLLDTIKISNSPNTPSDTTVGVEVEPDDEGVDETNLDSPIEDWDLKLK